jgi:hypothetical protein
MDREAETRFVNMNGRFCHRHDAIIRQIAMMHSVLRSPLLRIVRIREHINCFISWFNEQRPHQGLRGRTPEEVYSRTNPANEQRRFEPRIRWPKRSLCAAPQARTKGRRGARIELNVTFYNGQKALPSVELKKAA